MRQHWLCLFLLWGCVATTGPEAYRPKAEALLKPKDAIIYKEYPLGSDYYYFARSGTEEFRITCSSFTKECTMQAWTPAPPPDPWPDNRGDPEYDTQYREASLALVVNASGVDASKVILKEGPIQGPLVLVYRYETDNRMYELWCSGHKGTLCRLEQNQPRTITMIEAEAYQEQAANTIVEEEKLTEADIQSVSTPTIFTDECVFKVKTQKVNYVVACQPSSKTCRIQSRELTEAGHVAERLQLSIDASAAEIVVGEPITLADDSHLYKATARGKTYRVQCYDDGEHITCAKLGNKEKPAIAKKPKPVTTPTTPPPSYSSGPHCKTGCPCGNACISCAKTCHK